MGWVWAFVRWLVLGRGSSHEQQAERGAVLHILHEGEDDDVRGGVGEAEVTCVPVDFCTAPWCSETPGDSRWTWSTMVFRNTGG